MSKAVVLHNSWLEERRGGIGGSDAAAIIGLSRWATPYVVWADKTGRLPPREDTEAMKQGRDLEDYVAARFTEETKKKVRRKNGIIKNPKYPWALANIDRLVVGEQAGLECKTTSALNLKRFKNGEYPQEYYVQCVHYLAVTGFKKWYLAVLVLGRSFEVFEIDRDEDEVAALMAAEMEFWENHVLADTPPEVYGEQPTSEAIKRVYLSSNDDEADISHLRTDIDMLQTLKKGVKEMEKQIELHEQKIKLALGNSTTGRIDGYTVEWKPQTRLHLDRRLLIADYPELDLSQYENTTEYRKLTIR